MIQYLSWVGSRSAVGCMLNVLPNASHFWGHLQTSPIFGPHSAIRLAALNGFAQWCNSIDEDSNLIGYSRLLDIMADYVYCSSTNLLNAKGQTDPKVGVLGPRATNQACCSQWVGTMVQFHRGG